jgi:hypothetical protein
MNRILAITLPALFTILLASAAWADGPSPGGCFGGDGDQPAKKDASSDVKVAEGRGPTRSETRRAGVGLLSAAFVTSGWLFLRRQDPKR